LLATTRRRLDARAAAQGASIAFVIGGVVALLGWPAHSGTAVVFGAILAMAGTLICVFRTRSRHPSVAAFVERRVPASRNVILTASELDADASSYVATLVRRRAAAVASEVDVPSLVPARNAGIAFIATFAFWLVVVAHGGSPISLSTRPLTIGASGPSVEAIDIVLTPPSYAGAASKTLHDPARVDALVGSRLELRVRAHADSVALQTLSSGGALRSQNGAFVGSVVATTDGFLAVEPRLAAKRGARRLIGLTVRADAAPRVAIKTPGHDVRLPDGHRTLDIAIDADDDIGLASLRLRYTKVSGSGERFTFSEGDVPITVTRADARHWAAHASWKLDPLELGPGDMVVYRAIAADQRPDAAPTESDSYIAEVASVGGEAAAGFAVDPEQDRYAVSQQMVILKTERLLARRPTMSAQDYASEAQELAAEQRKVRAEFVFMLGGELADAPDPTSSMTELNEEAEAEGESDILAGRNANAGHVALLRAIRAMSRAASSLTTADLDPALPYERDALTQLESAFSHSRILLRALSTREKLDLSRRLTGVLNDAVREQRPLPEASPDARTVELRRALADVAAIAGRPAFDDSSSTQLAMLAERVLRVDPASKVLQDAARTLDDASREVAHGNASPARAGLDRAATALAAGLRGGFIDAPRDASSLDLSELAGALRDATPRGTARP
jgi:hypothetical protein